ncbi:unnamed protein product [Absidia cylindrospora]
MPLFLFYFCMCVWVCVSVFLFLGRQQRDTHFGSNRRQAHVGLNGFNGSELTAFLNQRYSDTLAAFHNSNLDTLYDQSNMKVMKEHGATKDSDHHLRGDKKVEQWPMDKIFY